MPLPDITLDPTEYGRVTFTGLISILDSISDPDDIPDKAGVTGVIIFKPSVGALKFLGASPMFTLMLSSREVNLVNAQVDEQGRKYIKLEASSAHATPESFTWTAVFSLSYNGVMLNLPDCKFALMPGQELDLSTVIDASEATYYTPIQLSAAVAAREGAEAARDEAVEARDEAVETVSGIPTEVLTIPVADATYATTAQGSKADTAVQPAALTSAVAQRAPALTLPLKRRAFHGAYFNAARGRAIRVAVIGSSTSEGAGTSNLQDRYIDQLGMRLQRGMMLNSPTSLYQPRFLPTWWATSTFTNPVLAGSTRTFPTDPTYTTWYGPGGRDCRIDSGATPGSITWTLQNARRVRVWHVKSASGGVIQYTIDGTVTAALPTWNAASLTVGHRTDWIDLGTLGFHTFKLSADASNGATVCGLEVSTVGSDAEEANQVHVYDFARSGSDIITSSYINSAWRDYQLEWLKTVQPDLIILGFGSNAYASKAATPALIESNMRAFIADAHTKMGSYPSWLLVGQQAREEPASPLAPWADYVARMKAIADDTSGVSFLDWSTRVPSYAADSTWYADAAHLNRIGHAMGAAMTAQELIGAL
ncbi:tail protein [Gordonia phage SteveFrench]|uniref:Hydrolase n=2 Tax=Montyvirus stevefrench TaxID=2734258 RepID=A0A890V5I8_9CAUD|nr:tail protein [Gordonia phage SteveFrench]AUV60615.1 esterase [Gordonia phage SteveFrench]QRI45598.1 esterase [Gordonia phage RoyalG]